jgi:hypothetical protein
VAAADPVHHQDGFVALLVEIDEVAQTWLIVDCRTWTMALRARCSAVIFACIIA